MAGAVEQMTAEHAGAGGLLHALDRAWALVDAPIALARDEGRRHVDGLAGKQLQFGFERAAVTRAVPVEPALEAVAPIFLSIYREVAVGQPLAGGDLGRRR